MNPFSPTFVTGITAQESQYMTPANSNTTYSPSKDATPAVPYSVPTQALSPMNPILYTPRGLAQVQTTLPQSTPIGQLQHRSHQTEIISPICHRTAPSLLQQLNQLDIQDASDQPQTVSTYKQGIDKVTQPSEMPIGSLVHEKESPKYGVIKISNIPYSITKQEIFQFLGRQARLISPDQGCAIHIIMERSTAKTMDCYAEFQTPNDAKEAAIRINRIYETGRAPRLGNRHVDVELSDQNSLLKELFPRAKCIVWRAGTPYVMPNTDPYSTGFTGFFTAEEIIGAIRHAELPHRSPFCDKCPQRTYESTISTLYKFPWYATELYTVHDRNQLFELANRHILSLVSRIKKTNTVGLDQKLLHDLVQAGLSCPSFNERQKYTLCMNSEIVTEIFKFPEIGKWFPFDTLVKMPNFKEDTHLYYARLIAQGSVPNVRSAELPNMFPMFNADLQSPYGNIWFEWSLDIAKSITWENAVHHEMIILSSLVLSGWINDDRNNENNMLSLRRVSAQSAYSTTHATKHNLPISPPHAEKGHTRTESSSRFEVTTPFRRASECTTLSRFSPNNTSDPWNQKLLLYPPPPRARPGYLGHRITQSSPTCLPSPTEYWRDEK